MPVAQLASGRTFACVHCHAVVLTCSYCDWGRRYCSQACREEARRIGQREAGRRYQRSSKGRCAHARRQQDYRHRQKLKEVTHQSSQQQDAGAVLMPELSVQRAQAPIKVVPAWHCQWCARALARVVRHGFLRHAALPDPLSQWFGGITRGQSP